MTHTLLDDALMARMAGGTNVAEPTPWGPRPDQGTADAHRFGPCPNPDAFPKPARNADLYSVELFPFQPGG